MNDLEKLTLQIIGESVDSPDVFTTANITPIRDSLNDAIEEISLITGSSKRIYPLPLTENVNFYRLEWSQDQFGWITDAWLHGYRRRLEQTDVFRLLAFNPNWMQNSGTPVSYFPIGTDIVGVWPKPSAGDLILELTCVIIPGRYSNDGDRIKLQDSFKWAAVHFAVGEYYASRGDAKQALYHHQQYMEKAGIHSLYPKAAEKPWRIRTEKGTGPENTAK